MHVTMITEIAIITAATIVEGEATITMAITNNMEATVATTREANVTTKTTSAEIGTQISNTKIIVAHQTREDHTNSSKDLMILVLTMLKNVKDKIITKEHLNNIKATNSNMDTITITTSNSSSSPIQQHKANSTVTHITKLQQEWYPHPILTCRVVINTPCNSQISNSSSISMEDSRIIIKVADSGKRKTNGTTTKIGIEETIDHRHIEAVEVIMETPLKIDSKA